MVDEGVGDMAACVVVFSPQDDCSILFPFVVNVFTSSDTAGNDYYMQQDLFVVNIFLIRGKHRFQ